MKLRKRQRGTLPTTPGPVSPEREEAIAARVESEKAAARVRRDNATVRHVANLLRSHREENGFGALLEQSLKDVR